MNLKNNHRILEEKIIISLFDFSGEWSNPYRDSGYKVIQVELKLGIDIMTWYYKSIDRDKVAGILAAPPCTHYSLSGTQWWAAKDADGRTEESNKIVRKTLEIIEYFKPKKGESRKFFWSLENTLGRIDRCVPELRPYRLMEFNPCEFGEPYTKKTRLWGEFNPWLVRTHVAPTEGSKMWKKYGGKSERTKTLRSVTPHGFARAFFEANKT